MPAKKGTRPPAAGMGRKPGPNKRTKTMAMIAHRAALEGITPLEVMLRVMRLLYEKGMNATTYRKGKTVKYIDEDKLEKSAAIAKDAAPFVHPRLSSIEVIRNLTDDDLDAIIAGTAAQAGVSVSISGASAETRVEVRATASAGASCTVEPAPAAHTVSARRALLPADARGQPVSRLDAPAPVQDFLWRPGLGEILEHSGSAREADSEQRTESALHEGVPEQRKG